MLTFAEKVRDSKDYFNNHTDTWELLTEKNLITYRSQRRAVGPVYTMVSLKRHEHHVDEVLRSFMTKMTTTLAGEVVDMDEWIHIYALGRYSA
jgi:hypothetical protein